MGNGRKKIIKASAAASVNHLLEEAGKAWGGGQYARSRNYVQMAMSLVKKHKVRLTREQKLSFCRKCFTWWKPESTLKLFYDSRHRAIRAECRKCGYKRRL